MILIGYANNIILGGLIYVCPILIVYSQHPPSSNKINKRNNMNLNVVSIYA